MSATSAHGDPVRLLQLSAPFARSARWRSSKSSVDDSKGLDSRLLSEDVAAVLIDVFDVTAVVLLAKEASRQIG